MGTTQTNPNIIFILADDLGCWALGCAGNKEIKTPNIDRLAKEGMFFKNFFCASPVCSPARATLLTGRIPSQHGIHDWLRAGDTIKKYEPDRNGELIEYLKNQTGYTDILANAGYECGISGKWHLGDSHHAQKSFNFWSIHAKGGGPYYGAPMISEGRLYEEEKYVTDVITDNALSFINEASKLQKPFYLSVHYTAPHSPWGRDEHPKDIYDNYFNNCAFESAPWNIPRPDWIKKLTIPVKDEHQRREYLSGYYAAIDAMDRNIGRIINCLERNNLRENTVIIFTADNGMNMGHHGVFGKGNATFPLNMFEESVKVPFIISHPSLIKKGSICNALVSQYDFMPTLIEYAGIDMPHIEIDLPGKSFASILKLGTKDISNQNHEEICIFDEYGPVRMIRTEEWKLIRRYPYGPNELYCLSNDPDETKNLYSDSAYEKVKEELNERLLRWFIRYASTAFDGIREPVTGLGQLGMCGIYGKGKKQFADN